jgi:TldD protein
MKKVPYSAYLQEIEPKLKQLLELLEPEYGFVSVLSADTTGAAYRIGQKNKVIMEPMTCERGSVVRTVRNKRIHEYSFSSMEDPKDVAEKIREAAEREDQLLDAENIENYPTPDIQEEECRLSVEKEAEILPEDLSAEEIISRLQKISDEGAAEDPRILECVAYLSSTHVSKLYLSARKTMRQSYLFTEGMIMAVARENEDVRSDYSVYSNLGGLELLDEMNHGVHTVIQNTLQLLGAPRVEPGEYDIITTPGISG